MHSGGLSFSEFENGIRKSERERKRQRKRESGKRERLRILLPFEASLSLSLSLSLSQDSQILYFENFRFIVVHSAVSVGQELST